MPYLQPGLTIPGLGEWLQLYSPELEEELVYQDKEQVSWISNPRSTSQSKTIPTQTFDTSSSPNPLQDLPDQNRASNVCFADLTLREKKNQLIHIIILKLYYFSVITFPWNFLRFFNSFWKKTKSAELSKKK